MELKNRILLYLFIIIFILIFLNSVTISNYIINTNISKYIISKKINDFTKKINITTFHPKIKIISILESEYILKDVGVEDFSLKLNSLKNITLIIHNLEGYYKCKYKIGSRYFLSLRYIFKINFDLLCLNYTFTYDFFPFKIYYIKFSFDIDFNVKSKISLFNKVISKSFGFLQDEIKSFILEYLKKVPKKFEKKVQNKGIGYSFLLLLLEIYYSIFIISVFTIKCGLIVVLAYFLIKYFYKKFLYYNY